MNPLLPSRPLTPVQPPLPTGTAATPIAFVQAIVLACQRAGVSAEPLLQQAQITPQEGENPETRITAWQFERLSGLAMQALDDEALGWFSRRLPWGSYGLLARASISSPTLGVALQRWCRHHGLLTDDITLRLDSAGDTATLSIATHRDLGALHEFCLVSVLRNAHGLACWFIDSSIPLLAADFAFDAPQHADAYAVLFSAPTRFCTAQTALSFDARYLALPLRRDEAALQTMLRHALPLQVLQYRRDRLLVARVRQMLLSAPLSTHNAADMAARLNLSPRTLHRQLKDEGASLQNLKNTVRRELATDLLQRSQRPIKQVALAAGFQNEKSFIRAFKGWTGMTPGEWRGQ